MNIPEFLHRVIDAIFYPGETRTRTPAVTPTVTSSEREKVSQPVIVAPPAEKFSEVTPEITLAEKSFDEWDELFRKSEADSPLERFTANKVIETVETPENLVELLSLDEISDVSELRELALTKLGSMDATFEDWKEIRNNNGDDEILTIAVEKMIAKIETVDQLREAEEVVSGEEDDEKRLISCLQTLDLHKDDLEEILNDYDSDSFLFIAVVAKLLGMVETAPDCLRLYLGWDFEDEEDNKVLEKLFSLATSNESEIIAILAEEGSTLEEWAERQITS